MPEWRINRFRDGLALVFEQEGKRRRHSLKTSDPREAERLAPALYAELTRPKGNTVRDLWAAYEIDKAGLAIVPTMKHTFKALEARFGHLPGDRVTIADCRAHAAERRALRSSRSPNGIKDGTIHTELGHLRMVLKWAKKHGLIHSLPDIERPSKPAPKNRYLERHEAIRIIGAAKSPHIKVAMNLLLATAGRVRAILELEWSRVDFKKRQIFLADPNETVRRKGRAVVPMNNTLYRVLTEAKACAMTQYVIEWAGEPVASIKRGVATAAEAAGLDFVTPHVFRHTAAVWMAQGGTPMSEIAQYLGHSSTAMTEKVYARYSPNHLRGAASNLELEPNVVPTSDDEPEDENKE